MSEKDQRRRAIWRHNSFIGLAKRMEIGARTIGTAETTSPTAKQLAGQIYDLARDLQVVLRTERID
jgi:hypothetical protein